MNHVNFITVAVCTYNRSVILKRCIETLQDQDIDDNQYELIIINNNSSDDTVSIVNSLIPKYKNLKLFTEKRQGLSYARNLAIEVSNGDYILFLDDETLAPNLLLSKIIKSINTVHPQPIAVGFKILPHYDVKPPFWFDDYFETREKGNTSRFLTSDEEKQGFCGSCMAIKKTTLKSLSGFNTSLGMNGNKLGAGEETDLFKRISDNMSERSGNLYWYDANNFAYNIVKSNELTLKYRLMRSFYFGQSTRKNFSHKRTFLKYLVGIILLILEGIKIIIKFPFLKNNKKLSTNSVIAMQTIFWFIGYYLTLY